MRNFKKRLSDIISYIILSIIIIIAGAIILPNINLLYKIQPGFHFEKYKTAKEAKEALLELHPIGSDVEGLVRTLEGAGAAVKLHKTNDNEIIYFYEYNGGIPLVNPLKWGGGIRYNPNKSILDFGVSKHYMGL